MAVKAKASIRLKLVDQKQLAAAVAALQPEVNSPITHRANVDLQVQENFIVLTVNAEDTVALRATVNAYLRWIASTINVVEVVERM
ncbi:MAG: KEOPS complex subunit Pcc1 [Candidatus Bathyarchaeia archaeon]|jgi:tRNA threonylcarbamoyladenosine modification (KEOPS) complex  Pcc1 subunit